MRAVRIFLSSPGDVRAERDAARRVFERVEDNPFLPKFYKSRELYAFQNQTFFLLNRYQQQVELAQQNLFNQNTVADYLFAKDQIFASLTLSAEELNLYQQIYALLNTRVPKPDLVVYLRASVPTLLNRISNRGRDYERSIAPDYLNGLNSLYEQWIENFTLCPVLAVPADDLDFVSHPGHLKLIVQKVQDKLMGKEEVVFEAEEVARAARQTTGTSHALAVLIDLDEGADRIEFGGTVCLAIATADDVASRRSRIVGGREWVRLGAVEMGLDCLRRYLQGLPVYERIDFEKV